MSTIVNVIFVVGFILSTVINLVLCKLLSIQFKKLSIYEKLLEDYDAWVDQVKREMESTYVKMKSVDEKNLFYKDDDVGFVFQELLVLIKKLQDKIRS